MTIRNLNLDFAKAIACMGVIIMHCSFPGVIGKFIAYLFKFAVPLFFLISGYFLFKPNLDKTDKMNVLKRKALHIFKILIVAELLSAFYFVSKNYLLTGGYDFNLTWENCLINCFTGTFFNGTLWFVYALLWCYILLILIIKITPPYRLNYLTIGVVILFIHIVVRSVIREYDFYDVRMFRNAVMYALPFLLIGYEIRKSQQKDWYKRIAVTTPIVCILLIGFGYCMSVGEYALTHTSLDIYFGSLVSTWGIFTFCVNSRSFLSNKVFVFIGEKLSLYVYVVHLFVIDILSGLSNQAIYRWCLPVLSICVTIVVSYLYYKIKSLLSRNI